MVHFWNKLDLAIMYYYTMCCQIVNIFSKIFCIDFYKYYCLRKKYSVVLVKNGKEDYPRGNYLGSTGTTVVGSCSGGERLS